MKRSGTPWRKPSAGRKRSLRMDRSNLSGMRRIFGGDAEGKLHLLLDFAGAPRDVADPWYTDDFEAAYRDIEAGCRALLAQLSN